MSFDPKAPLCPDDGAPLTAHGTLWQCAQCAGSFQLAGRCDSCGHELERLTACGAVNWFCNHCKMLKSKSVVQYHLVRTAP